jgi:hypothetical protein
MHPMTFAPHRLTAIGVIATLSACLNTSPKSSQSTDNTPLSISTPAAATADHNGLLQALPNTPNTAPNTPALLPACTTGAADAHVTIISRLGPSGGAPSAVSRRLTSMNIDDQRPGDYAPNLNASYVVYLAALKPGLLRWPSGYSSQTYQFTTTGSGPGALTPALIDGFMNLCKAVGAEPLLGVNIDTGTAINAADWVHFMNQTRAYRVNWWQIGNEPDVDGFDATHNPTVYANKFNTFHAAMSAQDANIKFVGGELYTGADILGTLGSPDWLTPILQQTAQNPMDAIAWHYYPMDSSQSLASSSAVPTVAHILQESAPDWPPAGLDFASLIFPILNKLRNTYAPKAQLWVDEFAEDSGVANGGNISDRVVGALWAADALGRFAEQGADAVFRFIYKAGTEHKYSLIDENNVPRPEYYSYWLYAQHFGDHMVKAQTDVPDKVATHASILAADNTLHVVLVNKSSTVQRTQLTLADYAPKQAHRYQLMGQKALATTITLNDQTFTPDAMSRGAQAIASVPTTDACADTVLTLPPMSVTFMIYSPN